MHGSLPPLQTNFYGTFVLTKFAFFPPHEVESCFFFSLLRRSLRSPCPVTGIKTTEAGSGDLLYTNSDTAFQPWLHQQGGCYQPQL